MSLYIGCAGFVGQRERYWEKLNLVELAETFHGFPKGRQLRQVRQQAGEKPWIVVTASQLITHPPEDPGFCVPPEARPAGPCGLLRDTPAVWQAWTAALEAAEAVQARGLLLRTPPAFTPSSTHRQALTAFAERVRGDLGDRFLAWEPTGLWEPEDAAALAAQLGLLQAVNPLRDPPADGPLGYFRLRGLIGVRRRYSEEDFERLLEQAAQFDDALVVFDYQERLNDAHRLARLAAGAMQDEEGEDEEG